VNRAVTLHVLFGVYPHKDCYGFRFWTGTEFENLEMFRTRIRIDIQKFWIRSGFWVWKCDSPTFAN